MGGLTGEGIVDEQAWQVCEAGKKPSTRKVRIEEQKAAANAGIG